LNLVLLDFEEPLNVRVDQLRPLLQLLGEDLIQDHETDEEAEDLGVEVCAKGHGSAVLEVIFVLRQSEAHTLLVLYLDGLGGQDEGAFLLEILYIAVPVKLPPSHYHEPVMEVFLQFTLLLLHNANKSPPPELVEVILLGRHRLRLLAHDLLEYFGLDGVALLQLLRLAGYGLKVLEDEGVLLLLAGLGLQVLLLTELLRGLWVV